MKKSLFINQPPPVPAGGYQVEFRNGEFVVFAPSNPKLVLFRNKIGKVAYDWAHANSKEEVDGPDFQHNDQE